MAGSSSTDPAYWIAQLGLQSHPEGGYFRETFRSTHVLPSAGLGERYAGTHVASTAIYFLVTAASPSHFHRLQTDELWHFYAGEALEIFGIAPDGALKLWRLGNRLDAGESLQVLVPAGTWFGARVLRGGGYALCGCTMAPGFEFADFELAQRVDLLTSYPQHSELIRALTR